MAVAFVRKLGTVQNKTSQTATVLTTTAASAAGNLVVVFIAENGMPITSVVDSASNSYNLRGQDSNDNSNIYASKTTAAIPNGGTITVNWNSAVIAKAIVAVEFSGADNVEDVNASGLTGTSTTPSVSFTPTLADDLICAMVDVLGPTGDADGTADSDNSGGDTWHNIASVGTSGGSPTTNRCCGWLIAGVPQVNYKITTSAAAQTYNPTLGTSRNWGAIMVSFKASAVPAAGIVGPFQTKQAVRRAVSW